MRLKALYFILKRLGSYMGKSEMFQFAAHHIFRMKLRDINAMH